MLKTLLSLYVLVAVAAVALPISAAHAHDAHEPAHAEESRHSLLSITFHDDGHVHPDGEPEERVPGHSHGHTTYGHSHEVPSVLTNMPAINMTRQVLWAGDIQPPVLDDLLYGIDRPPKLT